MANVSLITGASRGLGLVIARFLASRGDTLILTARGKEALERAASDLRNPDNLVLTFAGDITSEHHRESLRDAVHDLGKLNLLVNNASTLGPSPQPNLSDYSLDVLRHVYENNVIAPLALIQTHLDLLKQNQSLVVNISSDAALGAYEGWGGYGSSKAALDLVSATLAKELNEDGVSVVSVDPGDMRTQMHQEAFPNEDISDRPLPEVTTAFWAWLFSQNPQAISGQRFQAQADTWLSKKETVNL